MYAIKINRSGRFIQWVNDRWYETDKEPSYIFSREECDKLFAQLRKHYVYDITIVDADGNEEVLSAFANKTTILTKNGLPKTVAIRKEEKPKKSIFKIDKSLLLAGI